MTYVPATLLSGEEDETSDRSLGEFAVDAATEIRPLAKQFEALKFIDRHDPDSPLRILAMLGGWGCVAASTEIYDPIAGTSQAIADMDAPGYVWALGEAGPQIAARSIPIRKGVTELLTVRTIDGDSLTVASDHLFLGARGWIRASQLRCGDALLRSEPPRQASPYPTRISSVEAVGQGEYWDVHVPGFENYWAGGLWHHNSAKTAGCSIAFLAACSQTPWTPAYGINFPRSAILAPTFRILKQSTLVQLDAVLSRELVFRRRGLPHNDLLLANGHLIEFHSGAGELEGASYCNVWIDEIHHPNFELRKFLNYQARAREPKANRLSVMVSGLPETGWVRDTFDKPRSGSRCTILNATKDNPHIKPEVLQEFLASCPSGEEQRLLGGEWMPPVGAVYPQFDSSVHIVDKEVRLAEPVHLSFDVGNFAAVLVSQEIPITIKNVVGQTTPREKGLLIVDQMLPDNESVDQICYRIKTKTEYLIAANHSLICVDPTTDRDEMAAIRRHFPGVRIVRRERGDPTYSIETGVRYVQRALRDALGNVRLYFARSLLGQNRGIIDAITRYRRREGTEEPIKDNTRDHVLDALRYVVSEVLPAERSKPTVSK